MSAADDYDHLDAKVRADLLRAGIGHPDEDAATTRSRLKNALQLIDDAELARLLECEETTVVRNRAAGIGPVAVRVGRSTFYRLADVAIWLDAHRDGFATDRPAKADPPRRAGRRAA